MNNKQKRAIFYIDGFNLYYGIKALEKPCLKWLNLQELAEYMSPADVEVEKIYYFTTKVQNDRLARERQDIYIRALEFYCLKVEVVYGSFTNQKIGCKKCGERFRRPVEKRTDVSIAVSMLLDAINNKCEIAYLVSGDTDLIPVINAVIKLGKRVEIRVREDRWSKELSELGAGIGSIRARHLRKCLLPQEIKNKKGKVVVSAPVEWLGCGDEYDWDGSDEQS